MPDTSIRIEEIPLGGSRIKLFADFPWRLYRNDPCWTPPLRGDLLGSRLLKTVGLLTKEHPYHQHAEVTHFLAWRGGQPMGRISAAINRRFNEHYNSRIGFFGFFEVIEDYDVARLLLDNARAWIKERGMTIMRGPGEYSNATHERQGILIEGFQYPPMVELTHNPLYYSAFLDRYGFRKAKDYYAYITELDNPDSPQLGELVEQIKHRRNIETRPLNFKELVAEIKLVISIYNDSWAQNWGFLPITDGEAYALAESLRPIIDPGLVRFAFIDGEPAAVLGSFPDPNYALRPRWRWYGDSDFVRIIRLLFMRRHIPGGRLMFFGIRPGFRNLGIDALLYHETREYALRKGYRTCEASMLLEDNDLILRACESMGAQHYKTWRIYDLNLDK